MKIELVIIQKCFKFFSYIYFSNTHTEKKLKIKLFSYFISFNNFEAFLISVNKEFIFKIKMFLETFIVVSLLVCPIVYYISTKNKREKIDFHGKHIGKLGITMIH